MSDAWKSAVARAKAAIRSILTGHSVEIAAAEHEAVEVVETGFAAAEPELAKLAETGLATVIHVGAAALEADAPVLTPAIEAGAAATEKAADGAIESELKSATPQAK